MSLLGAGSPIPLFAFLDQGETYKYVQAAIYNADGSLYATQNLTNNGNGNYSSDAQLMPSNSIHARYKVYDDANYQIENQNYTMGEDIFTLPPYGITQLSEVIVKAKVSAETLRMNISGDDPIKMNISES